MAREISEEDAMMMQYENELALQQQQQAQQNIPYASAMFGQGGHKQNLIEYELDFKPELESIQRLLRCDVLMTDKEGNEYWAPNPDKSRVFFNDLGVNDIIRNIIILVNKNKALSQYNEEEINLRVCQIKHELRVLIYNNYEEYGMDNDYKMNNYSMIVLAVGSIIEDVYRRAMNGETHRGLNEQRIVSQTENVNPMGNGYPMQMQSQNKKKWYNPFSWRD